MLIRNGCSVVQDSTDSSTLVTGSIIDTSTSMSLAYTLINTGANTISWIVYGANLGDLSDKVIVQASADVLANGIANYAVTIAPYRFYGVYIVSKVAGNAGQATLNGVAKG